MATKHLEIEVKFVVPSFTAIREHLTAAGAVVHKPRVFERNVIFDTADRALRGREQVLRLRQDTAVRLTFKGQSPEDAFSEAKIREELEVTIDDFDTAVTLLERLNFHPWLIYEKYRETYRLSDVEITLDEMPYGLFIELEGPETAIKSMAAQLELDWNRRVLSNYLEIMVQLKKRHALPFDDITFENFRNLSINAANILS